MEDTSYSIFDELQEEIKELKEKIKELQEELQEEKDSNKEAEEEATNYISELENILKFYESEIRELINNNIIDPLRFETKLKFA